MWHAATEPKKKKKDYIHPDLRADGTKRRVTIKRVPSKEMPAYFSRNPMYCYPMYCHRTTT
jgi:hypothetical protein